MVRRFCSLHFSTPGLLSACSGWPPCPPTLRHICLACDALISKLFTCLNSVKKIKKIWGFALGLVNSWNVQDNLDLYLAVLRFGDVNKSYSFSITHVFAMNSPSCHYRQAVNTLLYGYHELCQFTKRAQHLQLQPWTWYTTPPLTLRWLTHQSVLWAWVWTCHHDHRVRRWIFCVY